MYEGDRIHTYANVHAHVPHMIVLVSTFALVRQLIHTCVDVICDVMNTCMCTGTCMCT